MNNLWKLRQGVKIWNEWRKSLSHMPNLSDVNFPEEDMWNLEGVDFSRMLLSNANFTGVNLSGSNLTGSFLDGVRFRRTNLSGANLSHSLLTGAEEANLSNANLSYSPLITTIFNHSELTNTDFTNTEMIGTVFAAVDLSTARGLDSVKHTGPSTIGIDTIYRSGTNIPGAFLRNCGVSDRFITYSSSLVIEPVELHSCFISYSTKDEEFAKRLYSRMRDEHMRVWFAPEHIKGGQKLYEQIDRAIQMHDRLLLVLSEYSMQSEWVITEIRNARKIEIEETRRKLFPIRLVDFERIRNWKCFDTESGKDLAIEVREYFIPDFSNWKDNDAFEDTFKS